MAKATRDLTAKRVEALKAEGRYHDPLHRGLYLQVGPTGKKSWLLRYEHGGRERWHGLGSAADFSLKEARERARKARQLLADGIDPVEAKKAAKAAVALAHAKTLTFEEANSSVLLSAQCQVEEPQARRAIPHHAGDLRPSQDRPPVGRRHRHRRGAQSARTDLADEDRDCIASAWPH